MNAVVLFQDRWVFEAFAETHIKELEEEIRELQDILPKGERVEDDFIALVRMTPVFTLEVVSARSTCNGCFVYSVACP